MDKKGQVVTVFDVAVVWIEGFVAVMLVVIAGWAAVSLVASIIELFVAGVAFDLERYVAVLDVALLIFVVVELFRIARAYLKQHDVIPTVLEAGLVAIARKLVTFDTHASADVVLMKAGALAVLLLAVGLTWYLLAKRNPALLETE